MKPYKTKNLLSQMILNAWNAQGYQKYFLSKVTKKEDHLKGQGITSCVGKFRYSLTRSNADVSVRLLSRKIAASRICTSLQDLIGKSWKPTRERFSQLWCRVPNIFFSFHDWGILCDTPQLFKSLITKRMRNSRMELDQMFRVNSIRTQFHICR